MNYKVSKFPQKDSLDNFLTQNGPILPFELSSLVSKNSKTKHYESNYFYPVGWSLTTFFVW